ncbi:MAG: PD40 domain-containing protein [Anaerolineae bacterium]|nr:PD40 domain-containing protein [Anaerolineae bacterium]
MPIENNAFIVNPYIAGSPVKDSAMFFGRDDVYAWLRQHLRGEYQDNAIVLYGERRAGKTSVLYHMPDKLGDDTYVPVLLDLQGMGLEGMDGLLWEMARKIGLALRRVEGLPQLDRPDRRDFEAHPRHHFEEVFLPPIIEALKPRRLLLMFDETNRLEERVQAGELPDSIFDYLRSLIQGTNHLNFIFALGSRVEEARDSSQLFNLAVYRKISFLERDFAEDLITGPVAKYYTYTPAAIERILRLTSGQPYYTQLLCHNLFTRWTERKPEQLDAADVDAVLSDVIEQATPNLQFIWDDSAPVEQALLAALAHVAPQHKGGVMRRNLERTLRSAKFYPPPGEVTTGLKRLFERDIINSQEPYEFRIELIQQWLRQYKQLGWVREELNEAATEWERLEQQRLAEAPTSLERARRWLAPALGLLLLGLLVFTVVLYEDFQDAVEETIDSETRVAELAALVKANSTQAAESQMALILANTRIAEAQQEGDTEELAKALASATMAVEAIEASQATATSIAVVEATVVAQITPPPPPVETTPTEIPVPPTNTPQPTTTATPTSSPTPTMPALAASLKGTIAYPVFAGTSYDLYFGNVAGGETIRYRREASQPAFNADGSRIAFISWAANSRGLVTANSSGGYEILISNYLEDKLPTWSPDGSTILFLSRRSGSRASEFYHASPNADFLNNPARLMGQGEYPTWGANNQVIFQGWGSSGAGLRIAPANFSNYEDVTDSGADYAPALSPDGRQIVFMSNRESNWDIYRINADGSNLRRLTTDSAQDGLPTWSPNGRAIAFVSNRNGEWAILVMSADGGNLQKLFTIEGSPDGTVFYDEANSTGWIEERLSWSP